MLNWLIISSLAAAGNVERRDFLSSSSFLLSSNSILSTSDSKSKSNSNNIINNGDNSIDTTIDTTQDASKWRVTLPLERCAGGANCLRISIPGQTKKIKNRMIKPKRIYRTIIDTGSPYLVIPNNNNVEISTYFSTVLEDETTNIKRNDALDNNFLFNKLLPFLEWDTYFNYVDDANVPFELDNSSFDPTEDVYGSQLGVIEWKQSQITVRDNRILPLRAATSTSSTNDKENKSQSSIVLGVLDESLTRESGGPLLGLVKRSNMTTDKVKLRPTFFDQVGMLPLTATTTTPANDEANEKREITSFQIDSPNRQLILSAEKDASLIPNDATNVIEMVDLRPLGDFVEHYAFIVDELSLNGGEYRITPKNLSSKTQNPRRPIIAVFDTGLTGCLFTQPLWDALQNYGIPNPADLVSVEVCKSAGRDNKHHISIQSDATKNPFFYLAPIELDWFDDEENAPYVIVLGQTFLSRGALTIDIENRRATFELPADKS